MDDRAEPARSASAELRQAVLELKDGRPPQNVGLKAGGWSGIGKESIVHWVDDAERACIRIARALDRADAEGDTDDVRDALEAALWRITATCEKLEAVFVLCFGVLSLVPYGKTSIRFEPSTEGIKAKLHELAQTHEAARELARIGKELAEHPAVTLRDQLSHQLAMLTDAAELCWIDIAHLDGNRTLGWSGGPFYAANTLNNGAITREANWARAVMNVGECFDLLVCSFGLMAELVRAAAVLEPPQPVYKDEASGQVWTHDPRSGSA